MPHHHLAAGLVRGEPDYAEQVPRLASWLHAHPAWEVLYLGSFWQAILREEDGLTVTVRVSLGELLDRLDVLAG